MVIPDVLANAGGVICGAVEYAGGTSQVTVDQTTDGGRWNLIGTWTFASEATITIHSLGEGQSTCADAVRLVSVTQ